MKKIIIGAIILTVSFHSFSQQISDSNQLIKTNYLKKSKTQQAVGVALISGGTVLITLGILTKFSENKDGLNLHIGDLFIVLGGIEILPAIPLMIASTKNKKKALSLSTSFKMETTPVIQKGSFVKTSFPALSVKINL